MHSGVWGGVLASLSAVIDGAGRVRVDNLHVKMHFYKVLLIQKKNATGSPGYI